MAHDNDCVCDECCSGKIEINTKTYNLLISLLREARKHSYGCLCAKTLNDAVGRCRYIEVKP